MTDPNLLPAVLGAAGGLAASQTGAALVNRISDAIGWFTAPAQVRRMAEAEAAAGSIRAKSEIEISELATEALIQRAQFRVAVEQIVEEMNLEAIVMNALIHLNNDARPDDMDDDWLRNWAGRCKSVSDAQMQERWSRVLAGEANNPGTFSRKAVNVLADMDSTVANTFATYCGFFVGIGRQAVPLIILDESKNLPGIYRDQGIDFDALRALAETGLLSVAFEHLSVLINYSMNGIPETVRLSYGEQTQDVSCPGGRISIGVTYPTLVGHQLASICAGTYFDGFFEFIVDKWGSLCESRPALTSGNLGIGYIGE